MAEERQSSSPEDLERGYRSIRFSVLFASLISAPFLVWALREFGSVPLALLALGLVAYWTGSVLILRKIRRNVDRRIGEIQRERAESGEP